MPEQLLAGVFPVPVTLKPDRSPAVDLAADDQRQTVPLPTLICVAPGDDGGPTTGTG